MNINDSVSGTVTQLGMPRSNFFEDFGNSLTGFATNYNKQLEKEENDSDNKQVSNYLTSGLTLNEWHKQNPNAIKSADKIIKLEEYDRKVDADKAKMNKDIGMTNYYETLGKNSTDKTTYYGMEVYNRNANRDAKTALDKKEFGLKKVETYNSMGNDNKRTESTVGLNGAKVVQIGQKVRLEGEKGERETAKFIGDIKPSDVTTVTIGIDPKTGKKTATTTVKKVAPNQATMNYMKNSR